MRCIYLFFIKLSIISLCACTGTDLKRDDLSRGGFSISYAENDLLIRERLTRDYPEPYFDITTVKCMGLQVNFIGVLPYVDSISYFPETGEWLLTMYSESERGTVLQWLGNREESQSYLIVYKSSSKSYFYDTFSNSELSLLFDQTNSFFMKINGRDIFLFDEAFKALSESNSLDKSYKVLNPKGEYKYKENLVFKIPDYFNDSQVK